MNSSSRAVPNTDPVTSDTSCPLDAPLTGRLPGLLALAVLPAAWVINPLFIAVAGGLLAALSLLLSGPGCRWLGMAGLLGSLTLGLLRLL